jgi:hypothetical protein
MRYRLTKEVATRRADDERFARFVQLAREASDNMSYSRQREGHIPAKQALELFGVLSDPAWTERLDHTFLTGQRHVRLQDLIITGVLRGRI